MDMAVGIILGGATSAVVGSLVADMIMPVVGLFTGGVDFSALGKTLSGDSVLAYGKFIQAIINFLIIGFVIFMIVRSINKMKGPQEEEEDAPDPQVVLLEEIRDSLRK